jgi:WD40 repeat protein
MSAVVLASEATIPWTVVDAENPWPGLAAFREGDHEFFRGREADTESLFRFVLRERLTVLFGLAGLGKTSLLQAGLFPCLRQEGILPVYIRICHSAGSPPPAWQVKEAVSAAAAEAGLEGPVLDETDTLWEAFHRQDAGFWTPRNRPVAPLLIFDQFEEAFTLGRSDPSRAVITNAFFVELADLVEGRPPVTVRQRCEISPEEARRYSFSHHRYKVLLSLREDFLADLEALRRNMPSIIHNRLRLRSLNGDQARRVVSGPGPRLVSDDVADQVVRFVAGAHETREVAFEDLQIEPTLLSMACHELNELRKQRGEAAITARLLRGNREGILRDFYERSMASVGPAVRALVEDHLITTGGYRDSIALEDALATAGVRKEDLEHLLACYLLRREDRSGVARLELMHDVLTGVVRDSRNKRRQQEAEAAARRKEAEALERARRRARRLRWVAMSTMALVVGGASAVVWELGRVREADRRIKRGLAELEAQEASRLTGADRAPEALRHLSLAVRLDPDRTATRAALLALLIERSWWLPRAATFFRDGRVVAISPDGRRTLIASDRGTARVCDARTGEPIGAALAHGSWIYSAAWSPGGERAVTASYDGTAIVWELSTGSPVATLRGHEKAVYAAQWSADGAHIVTASGDKTARVWDARTGRAVGRPLLHSAAVNFAHFSPEGRRVVTAPNDGSGAWVWDFRTGQPVAGPFRHDCPLQSTQWSPDGLLLVTASSDRTARVWDARTGRAVGDPLRHQGPVTSARWSSDGRRIVTTSSDRTARVWDTRSTRAIGEPLPHGAAAYLAQFDPEGRVLTASWDWSLNQWDAPTIPASGVPLRHAGPVRAVQWSADGKRVLTEMDDGTRSEWDASTGLASGATPLQAGEPKPAEAPPGGRRAIVSHEETTRSWDVRVLDARTGRTIGTPLRHDVRVQSARLSPEGWRLLVASEDKTATVWDVQTGETVGEPVRHEEAIRGVEWSPDGERFVTASDDGTARVWDARAGLAIGRPLHHEGSVQAALWSPDGQRIATASADGTARLWDVPTASASDHEGALRLAEAVGGFDATGKALTTQQAFERLSRLREASSSRGARADGPASVTSWFLADPHLRALSPLSAAKATE